MGVTETGMQVDRHYDRSIGESSRLSSLNPNSCSHGAQFIARAVDGDYLEAAAL